MQQDVYNMPLCRPPFFFSKGHVWFFESIKERKINAKENNFLCLDIIEKDKEYATFTT